MRDVNLLTILDRCTVVDAERCTICDGAKTVEGKRPDGVETQVACHCVVKKMVKRRIEGRIPKEFWGATMNDLNSTRNRNSLSGHLLFKHFSQLQTHIEDKDKVLPPIGILVRGPYGVGKSYAAAAFLRWFVEHTRGSKMVVFKTHDQMASDIVESYKNQALQAQIAMENCAPLYVLDDLGRNSGGEEHNGRILTRWLNDRNKDGLVTIVTTNKTKESDAWVNEANESRASNFLLELVIDGKDLRKIGGFRTKSLLSSSRSAG